MTVLVPKSSWVFLVLLVGLGGLFILLRPRARTCELRTPAGVCFAVERAVTPLQKQKGLSGRDSLPLHGAMVFEFDNPDRQCFWMKDMRFALDIVWLDRNRKVIEVMQDVKPETYPESFCVNNAQYVVETNAGVARRAGIEKGKQIRF